MVSKKTGHQPDFSFGLKLFFKEKKPEAATDFFMLTHTTNGHNKFYNMKLLIPGISGLKEDKITVMKEYGKIGHNANVFKKVQNFQDIDDARRLMQRKLAEQLKKGYKIVKH